MKTGRASHPLWVRSMSMQCVQLLPTCPRLIKGYSAPLQMICCLTVGNIFFQLEPPDMLWSYLIDKGPLNCRAWCLQERYLSRRILSVHDSNRWIWECDSCVGLGLGYFAAKISDSRILGKTPHQTQPWIFFSEPRDGLFRR
jgi:hypothetical protein